jgi:hypothetical protein
MVAQHNPVKRLQSAGEKEIFDLKMESLLEIQRRCHEERERLQKLMVEEFMDKKVSEKDKIFSEHRVKIYMDVSSKTIFIKITQ